MDYGTINDKNYSIFFFAVQYYGITLYTMVNSPYNQVPNEYKNYGSYPVTLYNGDLQ